MTGIAGKVDYLTRRGHALLMEAVEVRRATPPWWKWSARDERRAAKARYEKLMAEAQRFADRASRL